MWWDPLCFAARHLPMVWPEPRHPDHQDPVTSPQQKPSRCGPQGNVELMAQKKVLDLKLTP
jgi:hypothetical protein